MARMFTFAFPSDTADLIALGDGFNPLFILAAFLIGSFALYMAISFLAYAQTAETPFHARLFRAGFTLCLGGGTWVAAFIDLEGCLARFSFGYSPSVIVGAFLYSLLCAAALGYLFTSRFGLRAKIVGGTLLLMLLSTGLTATGLSSIVLRTPFYIKPSAVLMFLLLKPLYLAPCLFYGFPLKQGERTLYRILKYMTTSLALAIGSQSLHLTFLSNVFLTDIQTESMTAGKGHAGLILAVVLVVCIIFAAALFLAIKHKEEDINPDVAGYTFPRKLLAIAFTLTLLAILWMGGNSLYAYYFLSSEVERDQQVSRLFDEVSFSSGRITEILTTATRIAQPDALNQYQRLSGQQLIVMQKLQLLAKDASFSGDVRTLNDLRDKVAQRESKVLRILNENGLEAAHQELSSAGFEADRRAFSDYLQKISTNTHNVASQQVRFLANNLYFTVYLVLFGGFILLIAWYYALRSIHRWQRELEATRNSLAIRITEKEYMEMQMRNYVRQMEFAQTEIIEARKRAEREAKATSLLKSVAAAANRTSEIETAIQTILDLICTYIDWPMGHAFVVDEANNALQSMKLWHLKETPAFQPIKDATDKMPFPYGVMLPGKVWETKEPLWLLHIDDAQNSPRYHELHMAGFRSGFAFPILVQGQVRYILEFFTQTEMAEDPALFDLIAEAVNHLIVVIERRRSERAMQQARLAAEAANAAKSDFLANMSHEIRTPMNGVLGMLSLILDTQLTRQQKEWAELARGSAESLLDIINDILDISKIEAGQVIIEKTTFNLHNTIESVTDLLYVRAKDKGLRLLVDLDPHLPRTAIGDPLRFRQIIINLVGNALKFTESGHILIRARAHTGQETMQVMVEIEDTGIGIAPEKQAHIFQKFSQENETITRRFGGTGLGLAISKKLVGMMDGDIGVRSEPGKGSVFWFNVMLRRDPAALPEVAPPKDFTQTRVLVVDPYPPSRNIVAAIFNSWQIPCDFARDPAQAFSMTSAADADNKPYHFIIIDVDKPGGAWWGLVQSLAQRPKTSDLLVILSLAQGIDIQDLDLRGQGVAGLMKKPLYPSQIFDMLTYLWTNKAALPATGVVTRHTMIAATAANKDEKLHTDQVPTNFPGLHVLLVEDQQVNQILMRTILEKASCVVDLAQNGIEAVDKVKRNHYDIVFMDCQMPEMDGFQATRAIRNYEEKTLTHVPIIALTADAMQGDKDRCLAAGMDDYINKPVKPARILEMMHKFAPEETGWVGSRR